MRSRTLSMVFAALALSLGLGLLAAGCGASRLPTPIESGDSEQPLGDSTISDLTTCVKKGAGDLKKGSYKLRFNVTANKRGGVSDVEPEGLGLDVDAMEECMVGALKNMTVPPFVYERAEEELASRSIPAHARGLVGQTGVAEPILIILTPVIIEAAPVVIIVIIGVVVVAAVATSMSSEMSEECEEEWRQAEKRCRALLKGRNPPRGVTGGYLNVEDCAKGLVSRDCGGNPIDEGNQGRPGRKY